MGSRRPGWQHTLLGAAMATWLAGCGSSATTVGGAGAPAGFSQAATTEYAGQVELQNGEQAVSLRLTADDPLDAEIPIHNEGGFTIEEGANLPSRFWLTVTTSSGLRMERLVDRQTSGSYLWINGASHLISRYARAHPELSLEQAEARVRQALELKPTDPLYGLSDSPDSPFAQGEFQRLLATNPGLADQFVQAVDAGRAFPIRTRPLNPFLLNLSAQGFGTFLLEQTGVLIFNKTVGAGVDFGLGKLFEALGVNIGSSGHFAQVQDELAHIDSELQDLINQQNVDFVSQEISDLKLVLDPQLLKVQEIEQAMQTATNSTVQSIPANSPPNLGPRPLSKDLDDCRNDLVAFQTQSTYLSLKNALTNTTLADNLLSLAAQLQSLKGYNISQPPAQYNYYPLRNDKKTLLLIQNFQTYEAWALLLGVVTSNYAGLAVLPSTPPAANYGAPATALRTAHQQVLDLVNVVHTAAQAIPGEVHSDEVLIDLPRGKMWYLKTHLTDYWSAQNFLLDLNVNGWGPYSNLDSVPPKAKSETEFQRPDDLEGWRLPNLEELGQLHAHVRQAGNSKTGLTNLGFLNLDKDNYKKVFFNGNAYRITKNPLGGTSTSLSYYDMDKGETKADNFVSNKPKYTAIYVRSIPGSFREEDPEWLQKAYGLLPSHGLHINSQSVGNETVDIRSLELLGDNGNYGQSHLSDRANWAVVNTPPEVAYLTYQNNRALLVFRKAGTAQVKVDYSPALPGSPEVPKRFAEATYTSSITPQLTEIRVTPQNFQFQSVPSNGQGLQFYCTGTLASRESVDLTSSVSWQLFDRSGPTPVLIPTSTNLPQFSTTVLGDLVFGPINLLPTRKFQVKAIYTPGQSPPGTWTEPAQNLLDTSDFDLP